MTSASGSTPGARRSAEVRFVASVEPMTAASDAPVSFTTGGSVGSFMSQHIASSGSSILSILFGVQSFDLTARPFPLRTSSPTTTVLPSCVVVTPQFWSESRYLLSGQPNG